MSENAESDTWLDDPPEQEGGYWVLDVDGGIQLGFVQHIARSSFIRASNA